MPQPELWELNDGKEYNGDFTFAFENNDMVDLFSDVIWYEELEPVFCKLITSLRQWRDQGLPDNFDLGVSGFALTDGQMYVISQSEHPAWRTLAIMLVSRFGEYATSPRYGWVPPRMLQPCINFLSYVLGTIPSDDTECMLELRRGVMEGGSNA